jgi:hypothetical protein
MKLKIRSLLLLISLVACRPVGKERIHLTLFSENCTLSCWQGPQIGEDAESIEAFLESVFKEYQIILDSESDDYVFFSAFSRGYYSMQMYTKNGRLADIMISTPHVFDLSFGQIIEEMGQPKYHQIIVGTIRLESIVDYAYIDIYYPQYGYVFRFEIETNGKESNFCFNSNTYPNLIHVVSSGHITDILEAVDYATIPRTPIDMIDDKVRSLDQTPIKLCE